MVGGYTLPVARPPFSPPHLVCDDHKDRRDDPVHEEAPVPHGHQILQ